ncbi:alpha-2-macroglobulin-like protein 1 [Panulirus ornatus]|uniref:alpha-2-macroglobulin-like protein 1 n=1 Tax=Panulirus ornatus TaxID=150431 RepID=UPI003A8732CE
MAVVLLAVLWGFCMVFGPCHAGHIITTPRLWTAGETTQVCVFLTEPTAPAGALSVHLNATKLRAEGTQNMGVILDHSLYIPEGQTEWCEELPVPETKNSSGLVRVVGQVGGVLLNYTASISLKTVVPKTFIQTDKFVYLPGQTVHFRLLTISGPFMKVLTEEYRVVWVTTPTNTRVAQWTQVDNSGGLVHLTMQLADEPELGDYTIHVELPQGSKDTYTFQVEEYVLPRFKVDVSLTKWILATDIHFTFRVCARYTFGEPVKGTVRLEVDNHRSMRCSITITKTDTISGCRSFKFTLAELLVVDCNVNVVVAKATVTEEGTGVQLTGTADGLIRRTEVSLKVVHEDKYMKPNLPFTVQVRAVLTDESPAAGVPLEVCAAGKCTALMTDTDGLVTIVLPSYSAKRIIMKTLNCRADMEEAKYFLDVQHYYSPSNSSLLIYAPDGQLKCTLGQSTNHTLVVLFATKNLPKATITVQVVSRGQIQFWSRQEYVLRASELPLKVEGLVEPLPPPPEDTIRGVVNIPLQLPHTTSPYAQVLVWYTRADGEVVADTRELMIQECLANPVTLMWEVKKAQPGDKTSYTLASEPDSLCSLGVVDKSTELLTSSSDPITQARLFKNLEEYKIYPWFHSQSDDHEYCKRKDKMSLFRPLKDEDFLVPDQDVLVPLPLPPGEYIYYSDFVDALKIFDDSGLYIFTDLNIQTRPCKKEQQPFIPFHEGSPTLALQLRAEEAEGRTSTGASPRTNFPETWLWDLVMQESSGISTHEVTLPDTITEWVGKAVCVHPHKGVGLSSKASLVTFTPFFLDLTLPPSVKRGEVLAVKISVFNFLDDHLPVKVTLAESSNYKIIQPLERRELPGQTMLCLVPQQKAVHTVKVEFLEFGHVNLTVSAFVDDRKCGSGLADIKRSDALIRAVKVEPEGFPKEMTWTKYICSKDLVDGDDSLEKWKVAAPLATVKGSDRGWVTVVGDLLGPTLENLGSLIRMSHGCGEQNMINFAPNIFILQYLEASKQTSEVVYQKLIDLMNTGYQRQLLYRRHDGSFSAFGNADESGSTWLTAFVLKSFVQAKKFILVDEAALETTSSWLRMKQDEDGCFLRVGKVIHKALKGGIVGNDSSIPLTAYVLISLMEAGADPSSAEVTRATACLLDSTRDLLDPYVLALKSYALALARHPDARQTLQLLLDQAVVQSNSTFWNLPDGPGKSQSLAVETAGYAILAMMTHDADIYGTQARKVVKWVSAQRNGRGGFYTTQDTVVALQALAVFETRQHQGPTDMLVNITATGLSHSFSITDTNKLLQQRVTLTSLPTSVSVDVVGQGCALLQAVLRYNVPVPESSEAFSLSVNARSEPDVACVTKRVYVCVAYLLADGSSNMAVVEVNLVSGYLPETRDLDQVVTGSKTIKKYEADGSLVTIYIDELTSQETCFSFRVRREVDVEVLKPGTVVVFDYYQPEFFLSESYELPPPEECPQLPSEKPA